MGALVVSFIEGVTTQIIFPYELDIFNHLQERPLIRTVTLAMGAIMTLTGHYLRISAEMQAGRNFNHQIQTRKEK